MLREAVRQAEQGTGGSAFDAAAPRVALATSLIDLGHQDEARTLLAAADAAWSRVADPDDPRRWVLRLVAARAATDAPAALHAAWVKNTPSEAQTKPKAMIWLAEAEAHAGRTSEARRWWLDALDALGRQGRPSSALAWRALHGLGMAGDPRARANACHLALDLFGPAAPQTAGCPAATTNRQKPKAYADLDHLEAVVDAGIPITATTRTWLDALRGDVAAIETSRPSHPRSGSIEPPH